MAQDGFGSTSLRLDFRRKRVAIKYPIGTARINEFRIPKKILGSILSNETPQAIIPVSIVPAIRTNRESFLVNLIEAERINEEKDEANRKPNIE